jgi:hypothetical protein
MFFDTRFSYRAFTILKKTGGAVALRWETGDFSSLVQGVEEFKTGSWG